MAAGFAHLFSVMVSMIESFNFVAMKLMGYRTWE